MKFSTNTKRWTVRLMLVLGLFAQGVAAAHACELSLGQVFAAKEAESSGMHCHDNGPTNANTCLEHCTMGDQVGIDHITHDFVAPNLVIVVEATPASTLGLPNYSISRVILDTGPPVTIRFCSFQI